jgi:hypothetical protein
LPLPDPKLALVQGKNESKRPVTETRHLANSARRTPARHTSPLTRELKEFIDRAIVPALVKQYLAELDGKSESEGGQR